MLSYVNDPLFDSIEKNIIKHHQLYPLLPLRGVFWESVLNTSLLENGHETLWSPAGKGSHKVGADIEIIDDVEKSRISVKGGTLINKTTRPSVRISSFRTTDHLTLEDKLAHIDGDHEDIIFSLAYIEPLKKEFFTHKYLLTMFTPLRFSSMGWVKDGSNWLGEGDNHSASITHSQSDQLWYTVPLDTVWDGREYILD
jgi:hypothetical protein|tara:strand:- start:765 stop:1358 length:594 start_codon:yes stop_codon:yes gene_type:complete